MLACGNNFRGITSSSTPAHALSPVKADLFTPVIYSAGVFHARGTNLSFIVSDHAEAVDFSPLFSPFRPCDYFITGSRLVVRPMVSSRNRDPPCVDSRFAAAFAIRMSIVWRYVTGLVEEVGKSRGPVDGEEAEFASERIGGDNRAERSITGLKGGGGLINSRRIPRRAECRLVKVTREEVVLGGEERFVKEG